MKTPSRRSLFKAGALAALTAAPGCNRSAGPAASTGQQTISLDGEWMFRTDADNQGQSASWQAHDLSLEAWSPVSVPHTWQVNPKTSAHIGVAWYRRSFDAPLGWKNKAVRIEFEAVYHSATVWVNGKLAGQHTGKGYTAFTFDISSLVELGRANTIAVRADNSFLDEMLPRGKSYDWTPDGGIIRPVNLLITPQVFVERVEIDAVPDLARHTAALDVRAVVRNASSSGERVTVDFDVVDDATGNVVMTSQSTLVSVGGSSVKEAALPQATLANPKLWHFDHPHLYRLRVRAGTHGLTTTFGVRKIETRDGGFYLNGERVWLSGVERMGGSHPLYGMAEPAEWIEHDHKDLKELNCVFMRVHWQQDRRVLDYCDRHGILIQIEVPTWGGGTFQGMKEEPSPAIMENALAQLGEMVARDRNHPSVFCWGLCNEIGGQNPAPKQFARRMFAEARRLDPTRLLTYASNSLQKTPEQDVAGEMDFISWNEYYGSWYKGDVESVRRNLEAIHKAFPGKAVVISEYGYCECTPDRLGGDPERIELLRSHNQVFRDFDYVGGLIYFSYNDYRTHMGDKGLGVMRQRVHGVVDLHGKRKPSFEALRREASPIAELVVRREGGKLTAKVRTRKQIPAYTLTGYLVRWTVYGFGGLPMEQGESALPVLAPGQEATVEVPFQEKTAGRIVVDVVRPTGFPAATEDWTVQ